MNFYREIIKTLEMKENMNKQCLIHYGQFTDNYGFINLDKNEFNRLFSKCRALCGKYTTSNLKEYYYGNMILTINRPKNDFYRVETLKHQIVNKNRTLQFNIIEKASMDIHNFPITDKYHNISKKHVMQFNFTPILIKFVTDKDTCSVLFSFYNKSENKKWITNRLMMLERKLFQ